MSIKIMKAPPARFKRDRPIIPQPRFRVSREKPLPIRYPKISKCSATLLPQSRNPNPTTQATPSTDKRRQRESYSNRRSRARRRKKRTMTAQRAKGGTIGKGTIGGMGRSIGSSMGSRQRKRWATEHGCMRTEKRGSKGPLEWGTAATPVWT